LPWRWHSICTSANGKQGQVSGEISRAQLTNRMQGNIDQLHADTVIT
jgi:hypothetical protein